MSTPVIYWYRQDLRTRDLPGLRAAAACGEPLIACYILDDETPGQWRMGGASRWWLHYSLDALAGELGELGGQLLLLRGDTRKVLPNLVADTGAGAVFCSRHYEPWAADLERSLHDKLSAQDVAFKRYPGVLLFEPGSILTQGDEPYKVFTPFWKQCLQAPQPAEPKPAPEAISWADKLPDSDKLADWALRPSQPNWAEHWSGLWRPGPGGAAERLDAFLAGPVGDYSEGRNHPAREATSRLSPHLHFGEISPRAVWHAARQLAAGQADREEQVAKFLSELGWREFSHHLLTYFPRIDRDPFKDRFADFPWVGDQKYLHAWQQGRTGYPVVDAGMRELWQTGYMHNRMRMVVASFLTKHLLIHWLAGARWFFDTLVDADLANNSCGWQWVAGSGADAAPYFRIFNPVTQGEKFDASGDYVRQWVPELAALPDRYLHQPWEAPAEVLEEAGVVLGETYPRPLVDHREAREAALSAYAAIKDD